MDKTPDIDGSPDSVTVSPPVDPRHAATLASWLIALRERGGSDLYLVAGLPPSIRIHGIVEQLSEPLLDGQDIEDAIVPALPSHAVETYRRSGHADASLRRSGEGRFRINLHRERGRPAASIRALPLRPPRLEELGLPPGVEALSRLSH